MASLCPAEPEVAHVFHLPLSDLASPFRLRAHQFRGEAPYLAVNVTDIVSSTASASGSQATIKWAPETEVDEVGGGRQGRLEVWGLTGWYVNLLMRALEVYV